MSGQTGRRKGSTRTSSSQYASTYQYGNTVRQFQVLPDQYDTSEVDKPRLSSRTRKNREKALSMNFGYVMFLTIAAIVTFGVCVSYLRLQAETTQRVKNISSLEAEVADLRADNDETYNRINNSIDLEHIRQVAIEEMGMVYASEDQVILYDNEESDYVRQYSDIPKAESSK